MVKDKYSDLYEKVISIEKTIIRMESKIDGINICLRGNGQKGLIRQVEDNTEWRWKIVGAGSLITVLLSSGLIYLGGIA